MHAKRLSASGWAALQLLAAACPALAQSAGAPDPWTLLGEVRRRLASEGAIATDFVQTYTPNGFTSGEKESGQLALAVPDCLRWDYEEPFPKGFLLCGEIAYQWTPGEPTGRRIQVEARQQAGLDLFLLPVAALQERYLATVEPKGERIEVELVPKSSTLGLKQARLALDAATLRPRWLAYSDLEGNRSRFDFSAYRTLADRDAFTPPPEVDWRDERPPHI